MVAASHITRVPVACASISSRPHHTSLTEAMLLSACQERQSGVHGQQQQQQNMPQLYCNERHAVCA